MRSSNSKGQTEVNGGDVPIQNGISTKEEAEEARHLAAKVVDDVVRLASEEAIQKAKNKAFALQKLPTIHVDTVSSPPLSPSELSENEELDENEIELELDEDSTPDWNCVEVKEDLKRYLEDILSKAMVVAQKKLQFVGVPSSDEDEDEQPGPSTNHREVEEERRKKEEELKKEKKRKAERKEAERIERERKEAERKEAEEKLEEEIRDAAEKVVEEVLLKATEVVIEKLEKEAARQFPPSETDGASVDLQEGLPTFQIDTVTSAPPSPEVEASKPVAPKKWSFKITQEPETVSRMKMITFAEAPDDVREAAEKLIKDIIENAVTQVMEKEKIVPTVPFNFEDVDLMKTSGPWYVRMREAFVRVLRTACFCTPRRNDS